MNFKSKMMTPSVSGHEFTRALTGHTGVRASASARDGRDFTACGKYSAGGCFRIRARLWSCPIGSKINLGFSPLRVPFRNTWQRAAFVSGDDLGRAVKGRTSIWASAPEDSFLLPTGLFLEALQSRRKTLSRNWPPAPARFKACGFSRAEAPPTPKAQAQGRSERLRREAQAQGRSERPKREAQAQGSGARPKREAQARSPKNEEPQAAPLPA